MIMFFGEKMCTIVIALIYNKLSQHTSIFATKALCKQTRYKLFWRFVAIKFAENQPIETTCYKSTHFQPFFKKRN